MVEVWGWKAQLAVEVFLLGYGTEEVVAADHVGDAHEAVVDDYGELVCPCSVSAPENEVAAVLLQVVWYTEAYCALGESLVAAGAGVDCAAV